MAEVSSMSAQRRGQIADNLAIFGEGSAAMNWVSDDRAQSAGVERARLLAAMGDAVTMAHRHSKPHLGPLSPGCRSIIVRSPTNTAASGRLCDAEPLR